MRGLDQLLVDRPLAFLDCETTGTSVTEDRIVELGVIIVYPLEQSGQQAPLVRTRRLNPTVPIPAEATAVHGISDADVKNEPTFREVAHSLFQLLNSCDFAGFNLRRFDLPLLRAEFRRCGMQLERTIGKDGPIRRLIDLQYLFHLREPRDLGAAVRFYLGRDHAGGHTAGGDTAVLLELIESQLRRYEDLPCTMDGLHAACDEFQPFRTEVEAWFGDDLEHPVFLRGRSVKGMTLEQVLKTDAGFIHWMLSKAEDIDEEVKEFVRRYRQKLEYRDVPRPTEPTQASLGV
ncbi:MAG: exonuclease domain-containing protein [Thermoanaerobaculia bacterium]